MFGFFEAIYSFLMRQIGNRTDTADANGSLHSKVKELRSLVDTLEGSLGQVGDAANASGTVNAKIKELRALVAGLSNIKSIQRGTITIDSSSKTVTISSVNPAKCLVLLNGSIGNYLSSGSAYWATLPFLNNLTATQLTIDINRNNYADAGIISWQVIEFI